MSEVSSETGRDELKLIGDILAFAKMYGTFSHQADELFKNLKADVVNTTEYNRVRSESHLWMMRLLNAAKEYGSERS